MPCHRTRGFSLIELLITLAIATIVIMVAVPSFQAAFQSNRAATQSNELLTALMLARSEAVKRGIQVSVCSSTDQATCAAATNWATGWIVFTDEDADGSKDLAETIIRVWDKLNGNATLVQTGGANNVQYTGTGIVVAKADFQFRLAGNDKNICINATGRPRVIDAAIACP